jgi:hypothetical protein
MTSNARRIENLHDSSVAAEKALRVQPKFDFEFGKIPHCSPQTLQEINEFLDTQDTSHPFQWSQWSEGEAFYALLRCDGCIRWYAQCGTLYPASRLLRPIRALTVNRGPVCDDFEMLETGLQHLIAEARRRKIAYIEIMPEWTGEFAQVATGVLERNGWQSIAAERGGLRLSLDRTPEQLLANFRPTTRHRIRKAEDGGVDVTIVGEEAEFSEFIELYSQLASKKQFLMESRPFLMKVFHWVASDRRRGGLFLAREAGRLTGGILVVRSSNRCCYILGATAKHSKLSAGHLLQWRAINWAKDNGCFEYDFGGFREGMTTGPAHFKSGFSNAAVLFAFPHRYVVNAARFRASEFISSVRRRFAV